jgi:hypothetical protein
MTTLTLPLCLIIENLRLVSESNLRGHWRTHHARHKAQRADTYWWLRHVCPVPPALPITITITRVAPRPLDGHDNLAVSAKSCVDGIADWLDNAPGRGQDRRNGLVWVYKQRRGGVRQYAVEITIAPGEEDRDAQ